MFSILKTGKQMTVLTVGTGAEECEFLFSYQTFVAACVRGTCFKTAEKFSVTTSRHVNEWLDGRKCAEVEKHAWNVWRAEFVSRYVQLCAPQLQTFRDAAKSMREGIAETWEVIVSNVGNVHSGRKELTARIIYNEYVGIAKDGTGKPGSENVTLLHSGEIEKEFIGKLYRGREDN